MLFFSKDNLPRVEDKPCHKQTDGEKQSKRAHWVSFVLWFGFYCLNDKIIFKYSKD